MKDIIITEDIITLGDYLRKFEDMFTALLIIMGLIMLVVSFLAFMYYIKNSD